MALNHVVECNGSGLAYDEEIDGDLEQWLDGVHEQHQRRQARSAQWQEALGRLQQSAALGNQQMADLLTVLGLAGR